MNIKEKWNFLRNKIGKEKLTKLVCPRSDNKFELLGGELVGLFRRGIEELSFRDAMVYPMRFVIFLTEEKYADIKPVFGRVLEEFINIFYEEINKYSKKHPDCRPMSRYWYFQLVRPNDVVDNRFRFSPDGESYPFGDNGWAIFTYYQAEQRNERDGNTNFSRGASNSVGAQNNINLDAIGNVLMDGDDYQVIFDEEKISGDKDENKKTLATLKVRGIEPFDIFYDDTFISGRNNDTRVARFIFKIGNDRIIKEHVHIKHVSDKKFQIEFYGPSKMNQRSMTKSTKDKPVWYDLENGSTLLLNDEVSVMFEINNKD